MKTVKKASGILLAITIILCSLIVSTISASAKVISVDEDDLKYVYDTETKVMRVYRGDIESADFGYWCSGTPEAKMKKLITTNGVTGIKIDLYYFKSLETVSISKTVKTIKMECFCDNKLKRITVNNQNKKYSSKGGVLFNKKKTLLYTYPAKKPGSKYTIPKTVKKIGEEAFISNKSLKNIIMPNSVKKIGPSAFRDCRLLNSVKISNRLKAIPDYCFMECKKLKKIKGFKRIETIGSSAFESCRSINGYTSLPKTLKKVDQWAFTDCPKMKGVIISSNPKLGIQSFGFKGKGWGLPIESFTIYSKKNTHAHKYAQENGFKFVAI